MSCLPVTLVENVFQTCATSSARATQIVEPDEQTVLHERLHDLGRARDVAEMWRRIDDVPEHRGVGLVQRYAQERTGESVIRLERDDALGCVRRCERRRYHHVEAFGVRFRRTFVWHETVPDRVEQLSTLKLGKDAELHQLLDALRDALNQGELTISP